MFDTRLSIEKMLNGRYSEDEQYAAKDKMFKEWNKKLGFTCFGSSGV
jgi:hypothetical protein